MTIISKVNPPGSSIDGLIRYSGSMKDDGLVRDWRHVKVWRCRIVRKSGRKRMDVGGPCKLGLGYNDDWAYL